MKALLTLTIFFKLNELHVKFDLKWLYERYIKRGNKLADWVEVQFRNASLNMFYSSLIFLGRRQST